MIGGVRTYFDLKDKRLDRERQDRQDQRAQEAHDLNKKILEMNLQDRPRDLAWEQAQRIEQALGLEAAFDNPAYIDSLKTAGVPVQQGTPGNYLMAAPDMQDGSQGIGPNDVTPNTGVALPWKVQYNKALELQKMQEQQIWGMIQSGQVKLDPNNPVHRLILSKMQGVSANEVFGPVDTDPDLSKHTKKAEIDAKMRAKYRAPRSNSNPAGDAIKAYQEMQIFGQIQDDAVKEANMVVGPDPVTLSPAQRISAGLTNKPAIDEARKSWLQARQEYIDEYVSRQMQTRGLGNTPVKGDVTAAPAQQQQTVDFATQGRVGGSKYVGGLKK